MLMNCLSQTAVNAAPGLLNLVSLHFTLRSNSGLATLSSARPPVKPTLMIAFAKLCRPARSDDRLEFSGMTADPLAHVSALQRALFHYFAIFFFFFFLTLHAAVINRRVAMRRPLW